MTGMAPILVSRFDLEDAGPNLAALGASYIALAIAYTLVLSVELFLLYRRRSIFAVRIRNIKIIFGAVSMLQIYLILVLMVYPLNGLYPCEAEFWVMSIFLPCGMALFQASNARLLKAYESQLRLQRNFLEGARKQRFMFTPRGLYEGWRRLDAAAKVSVLTVAGLLTSIVPALVLFFGSRRFHLSYGFFGPIVDQSECRRGAEWVPSILMQLFWSSVVGPWILWKIRKIHDVHSWALQTRLAILAGLPATPLWLAFTYARNSAMININNVFIPAGWFIPSLVICQQVLIVIPLIEAFKASTHRPMVYTSTTDSLSSETASESEKSPQFVMSKKLKQKVSMQALEVSLEHNIESLIAWAASHEFTAENTIFIREVRKFKNKWTELAFISTGQRRQMFKEASLLFFTLVNPFTAEAPINLEYKVYRGLQDMFSEVEYDPYMPKDNGSALPSPAVRDNVICPWEAKLNRSTSFESNETDSSTASVRSIVPAEFNEDVFDDAVDSIKYLVFTNTWPRYVDAELSKTPQALP